ncbi:hypothetical protein FISHEDRAFT_41252 [Fistulina hepatica ATCC 64428]|nr:hypothetical protein FISHEDRAFT_41252 [Fistulina hepatica ATCC 64428]
MLHPVRAVTVSSCRPCRPRSQPRRAFTLSVPYQFSRSGEESGSPTSNPLQQVEDPSETYTGAKYAPPLQSLQRSQTSQATVSQTLLDFRLQQLREDCRNSNAMKIWVSYLNIVSSIGLARLPLALHQEVLRKVAPSPDELRAALDLHLADVKPNALHPFETHFDHILRNIRATSDAPPTLDDYHFILRHFAAVGHYVGAQRIYAALRDQGLTPRSRTYGLCLQALAHRLSLPVFKDEDGDSRTAQCASFHNTILADMQAFSARTVSANVDLHLRVLKATADVATCDRLLKVAYAVDLANPDRVPLEFLDIAAAAAKQDGVPLRPVAFSTAALNTVIDLFGDRGDISRMVQAFEVLTKPLPPATAEGHFASAFDDDDDFGVTPASPVPQPGIPPRLARANTLTYTLLVRYAARAGNETIAQHYFVEAMQREYFVQQACALRLLEGKGHKVRAPNVAVNRGMALAILGLANREKDVLLTDWLVWVIEKAVRRKMRALAFFKESRHYRLEHGRTVNYETKRATRTVERRVGPIFEDAAMLNAWSSAESEENSPEWDIVEGDAPSDFFSPSLSLADVASGLYLLSDVPRRKLMDIDMHITILERDIEELTQLYPTVFALRGRTTQRIKERLGRRVWATKDIFLRTEDARAVEAGRQRWRQIANFKPKRHPPNLKRILARQIRKSEVGFVSSSALPHRTTTSPSMPSS